GHAVHLPDLQVEAAAAFAVIRIRNNVAVIDLGDDREHRHLEQDRMEPRSLDRDVDVLRAWNAAHLDEPLVQLEEAQEIDVVALEKAPAPKVVELAAREAQ